MCGTIGNDSGVTIGKTSPGGGSGPSIAQNNITKVVDLGYYQPNTTDFQDKLDALNLTVLQTDSPVYFRAITKTETGLLIKQLFEFTPGKGVYNPVGATTTFDDLLIIEETYPNLADIEDILLLGNVIDLGELFLSDLPAYINSQVEVDLTDDSLINYFQFVKDGITYIYEYVGVPQIYGTATTNTILSTDFDLIYSSGNAENSFSQLQSFQQTLDVSEIGNKMKLVTNNNFINLGFDGDTLGTVYESEKIIIFGDFYTYNGVSKNKIVRLNADGSIDTSFIIGTGFNNTVNKVKIDANGKIIVAGAFTTYKGVSCNRLVRLNTDGSVDDTFVFGTGFNSVVKDFDFINDRLVVVGNFTSYNGTAISRIAIIKNDGSIDTGFITGTGFNAIVNAVAYLPLSGTIVTGGNFTDYNGTYCERLAVLQTYGAIDGLFYATHGFTNQVRKIVLVGNKIYVCGDFKEYLIRLELSGDYDYGFDSALGFDQPVNSVVVDLNSKIIVCGLFTSYKGVPAKKIIRLNDDATIDTSFSSGLDGFNSELINVTVSLANQYYCNGNFSEYQTISAPYFAIVNGTGFFTQNNQTLKFSFNQNGNKIAEYFSDLYAQLTNYELINKKLLEERISLIKHENIVHNITNQIIGSHTGDLTERVLYTFNASNLFSLAETIAIYLNLFKNASGGNVTYRIRIGTNGTTADNLAASFTAATVNSRTTNLERKNCVFVTGNFLRMAAVTSTIVSDNVTTGISTLIPIDYSNLKISITAQLTIASETTTLEGILITKIRK
jgi:uncharacterized delta-60 repeat protein